MRMASDVAGRFAFSPPRHPRRWRSGTMQLVDAALTPGTVPNVAVSLAVVTLLIPRIPNRVVAAAAGFAAGSILGR